MKVKRYLVKYESEVGGVEEANLIWHKNFTHWVSYGAMQHLLSLVFGEERIPWWRLEDEKEVELEEPDTAMLTAFKLGLLEVGEDIPYPDNFALNPEYVADDGIVEEPDEDEVPPPVEEVGDARSPHLSPQDPVLQEEK